MGFWDPIGLIRGGAEGQCDGSGTEGAVGARAWPRLLAVLVLLQPPSVPPPFWFHKSIHSDTYAQSLISFSSARVLMPRLTWWLCLPGRRSSSRST